MLNADMRLYNYFTIGNKDSYGQQRLTEEPQGQIKIAIYPTNQNLTNDIKYSECKYIGITKEAKVNDAYVIEYGEELLKVQYTNKNGRFVQVFLSEY